MLFTEFQTNVQLRPQQPDPTTRFDKHAINANLYQRKYPLSKTERSALMTKVKYGDTKPELSARRAAHAMGYRYRQTESYICAWVFLA